MTLINANEMTGIIYKEESYAIVGACFEVYNEKGCGFLEPVYQECLGIEFEHQRIPATGFELGLLVNFGHYPNSNTNALPRPSR